MKTSALKFAACAVAAVGSFVLFAGPAQDFDAAVKAGKPLSADAAYQAIVKSGAKVAPIVHYRAAEAAAACGKTMQQRDRLNLFLREEKGWTPEVEQSLWYLTSVGDDIEQFQRLAAKVPADMALWRTGSSMFMRFKNANRFGGLIKMSDVLFGLFEKDIDKSNWVVERLWESWRDNRNAFPARELKPVFAKYPRDDHWHWREIVQNCPADFNVDWALDLCLAQKRPICDFLQRAASSLDNDTYAKSTNRAEKASIEQRAKKMRAALDLYMDGKSFLRAASYCWPAVRTPKLFFDDVTTNGQSVAYGQLLERLLKIPFDKNRSGDCGGARWNLIDASFNRGRLTPAARTAFVDAHPDLVGMDRLLRMSSLGDVPGKSNAEKSVAAYERLCKKFPKQANWIRSNQVGVYAAYGEKAAVEKVVVTMIADGVNGFDPWTVINAVNSCKGMSLAEKIAVLKKGFDLSGWNNGWVEMEKAVKNHRNWELPKSKEYAAFIQGLNRTAAAQDPLRRAAWALSQTKDPKKAHEIAEKAMAACPARLPEWSKYGRESHAFNALVRRYFDICQGAAPEECAKCVDTLMTKISANYGDYNLIQHLLNRANRADLNLKYRKLRIELFGENDATSDMAVPRDSEKPYEGIDMKKMSPWCCYNYMTRNFDNMKAGPAKVQFMLDFLAARPLTAYDSEQVRTVFDRLMGIVGQEGVATKLPLKAMADNILGSKDTRWNGAALNLLTLASAAGRLGEVVRPYMTRADGLGVQDRLYNDLNLAMAGRQMPNGPWIALFDDRNDAEKKRKDEFGPILAGRVLPAMKAIPDRLAPTVSYNFQWVFERVCKYRDYNADKAHLNEKAVADAKAFLSEFARLSLAGLVNTGDLRYEGCVWSSEFDKAFAASNAVALARIAKRFGSRNGLNWNTGWMQDRLAKLSKTEFYEPFYLLISSIPGDAEQALQTQVVKYRATLTSKIPGIYPVGEKDPAYPLYVAADELSKKNSERAWQILQNPRNQTVFEREALKLPPDFVVWGVEQFRMQRGAKDALLIKARQIATALLAQESKIAPETAAAMILSRAEGYRDQQNFEAAKLEYQSIRDNPTYHATKYGKQAMFRAIDLQIASGNAQSVESTLEYWLSQNDREIQAQAHYFLAKLAFDRKDYDECIKQLRLVFGINFTHTEARFLHGEWKLATNNEVDETDVLVGDLSERDMIRPGNQLTVTVQDANLSVAGGGASIPVIVTTKPGADKEYINLYPSSRDPSNFKGLIEVQLGKACPSNRVIEVRGDDIVSYEIDPEFLKERGLPLNTPKRLRVIDDGKLAIGAGAPRTEEKKAEKSVRNLIEGDSHDEDSGLARKLRPGNPLYIVVKDRDCSKGGEADTVQVTITTSSGDRIEGFELAEEQPFSGIFRGKVETALPPPRAFASDTAAGMNAGDVINVNKKDGWKSLADGQPGKWLEVDTMDSHLFSEITLDTPSVEDIKMIKLVGRMGSRVLQLGQLPAPTEASKLYLRRQQQFGMSRSISQTRAFCQTAKAAKRVIVEKIEFKALQNNNSKQLQTAFFSGPCYIPEGVDSLRLRIVPASTGKDALADLWVGLAIDGEEVFTGQGTKLQNALMSSDITHGCHQIEFAVTASSHADDFTLLWEPLGKDPVDLPADWFKEDQHPALKAFVKDRVQVVKTANGFKALFDKPERLRSFRWEFADVKSPEIGVSRITATNDRGETILPVASDFSDSQSNRTLEVAPGDRITVKYEDERTTTGEKKVHLRDMASSFNDASVRFVFEEANAQGGVTAYGAFRFQPGDTLVMSVSDPDCDVTDEPDTIEVSVKNSVGEIFKKTLVESAPQWGNVATGSHGMHSGLFVGVLNTCPESVTNAPAKTLRVRSDDLLTVSYDDRENTDPGVPCTRTVRIFAARPAVPVLTLFSVVKGQEVDTSADAKVKLERIRRRPGNENVQVVYRDVLRATPMSAEMIASTNAIPFNVAAGAIPIRVNDSSVARHAGSKIMVEAVAHSELEKAAAEGRDPDKVTVALKLGGSLAPFQLSKGGESWKEACAAGTFSGVVHLSLGPIDPNIEVPEGSPQLLCVTGSDLVDITVLGEDGQPVLQRTLKLVSDATIGLTDSTFEAERNSAHVGESFFVKVDDADRDATDEPDKIKGEVCSMRTGLKRPIVLTETMPHSGIFTGRLRPVMFAPGETIPSVSTGGVASANEILTEERFSVDYGDKVIFSYFDEMTLPETPARTLTTTGSVFRGANGSVRIFSKRFSDRDAAVLVQFRLAECLFEQAKEFRKLKKPEKSAAAIAEGKFILEEALKNYPDSAHVVQGEFLLANLYQELATEQKDAGNAEKAVPLYQEALARFSQILGTWPEGEYAARSQYHKALCLEMLQDYNRAAEEYVKMTYLYPESDLVGEATIRLATYYYTKEKRYDISGHIYRNFQQRFPQHDKAARALFMAGSCYIKQAETIAATVAQCKEKKEPIPRGAEEKISSFYGDAVKTFDTLIEAYRDGAAKLRAQTLYWAGDASIRRKDYSKAYTYLKRTVFEYPETEWARRARGLLLQESRNFEGFE